MLLNCIAERMHVIFISEEDRESLSKVRQSFVTRACIKRNRAQPRRTSSPANAMSIRDPVPGRRSSRAIYILGGYHNASSCNPDHRGAENDKRQSRYVAEFLASQRQSATC